VLFAFGTFDWDLDQHTELGQIDRQSRDLSADTISQTRLPTLIAMLFIAVIR